MSNTDTMIYRRNPDAKLHKQFKEAKKRIKKNPPEELKETKRRLIQKGCIPDANSEGFILDSSEVWETKLFSFGVLQGQAYVGVLLPRMCEISDKKGTFSFKSQEIAPAIITSGRKIGRVSPWMQNQAKIRFQAVPTLMQNRWQLESIRAWVEGFAEPSTFKDVFEKIRAQYKKYLGIPSAVWYDIHAIWDMATYFFVLFKVFPIFELRGLKGTAKSKTMGISSCTTFNSTGILINPSEATLFRDVHEKRPTKYIDEAERLFYFVKGKLESDPRVDIINSSLRCDGVVPRQEKVGNRYETKYYSTYSPTMVSSINGLHGATESRAIIRITTHTKESEKAKSKLEPNPSDEVWQEIRNELYILTLSNWNKVAEAYDSIETDKLDSREFWIWKPILAIAKLVSQDVYDAILSHAATMQDIKQDDEIPEGSIDFDILRTCKALLIEGQPLYTKTIRTISGLDLKEKTISTRLDKLGFRDFRKHNRSGSYFDFGLQIFTEIIQTLCPQLFEAENSNKENANNSSHSSQSSHTDDKEVIQKKSDVTNGDETGKNVMKKCDECDESDECDDTWAKHDILKFDQKCLVWHRCAFPISPDSACNETPCNEFGGMYFCEKHFEEVQRRQARRQHEIDVP